MIGVGYSWLFHLLFISVHLCLLVLILEDIDDLNVSYEIGKPDPKRNPTPNGDPVCCITISEMYPYFWFLFGFICLLVRYYLCFTVYLLLFIFNSIILH